MAGKGSGKKTGGKTGSPAKPLTSNDSYMYCEQGYCSYSV